METPEGLTALEYGRHLCEEILGWPSKGNLEMLADCITSVSKSRRIKLVQAHGYMERAVRLAKEQGITIDRLFFLNGDYTNVRPPAKEIELKTCANCKSTEGWETTTITSRLSGRLLKAVRRCAHA